MNYILQIASCFRVGVSQPAEFIACHIKEIKFASPIAGYRRFGINVSPNLSLKV